MNGMWICFALYVFEMLCTYNYIGEKDESGEVFSEESALYCYKRNTVVLAAACLIIMLWRFF